MPVTVRRIYQFKFYLNASHYVIFDGQRGETHPHTWEFTTKIQLLKAELVPFKVYEDAITEVFAPYQNKELNGLAPFDTIVPSLESLVEVFGERVSKTVSGLDAVLVEFEGSETPTRSYLLNYEDQLGHVLGGNTAPAEAEGTAEIFDRLLGEIR